MDANSKTALCRLPLEVWQEILAALDDVSALRSAAVTCHLLRDTLLSAEENITTRVLLNQINPVLLHDAIAAQKSSSNRSSPWSRTDTLVFFSEYLDPRQPVSLTRWKLSDALPMGELYENIRYLSLDLASKVLAKKPVSGEPDPSASPLSANEMNRIERTLYRYEIYCNIFFNPKQLPFLVDREQMDVFFSHFAHWENEQLACIHQYLHGLLSPVFETHLKNDLHWAKMLAENGFHPSFIQTQLSHGLKHVRRFMEAETSTRQKLLNSRSSMKSNSDFLSEALEEGMEGRIPGMVSGCPLNEYDNGMEQKYIPKALIEDPDPGPEDVWRWAHQTEPYCRFVLSDAQTPLRDWAYVMWDRERLDAWGVFAQPWLGLDLAELEIERSRQRAEDGLTFATRASILQHKQMQGT